MNTENTNESVRTYPKKPYLVVIWDKAYDSFDFIVTCACCEEQAKHQAWIEQLENYEIPEEERDEEFSKDGGMAGLLPVFAIEQSYLDVMFAERNAPSDENSSSAAE